VASLLLGSGDELINNGSLEADGGAMQVRADVLELRGQMAALNGGHVDVRAASIHANAGAELTADNGHIQFRHPVSVADGVVLELSPADGGRFTFHGLAGGVGQTVATLAPNGGTIDFRVGPYNPMHLAENRGEIHLGDSADLTLTWTPSEGDLSTDGWLDFDLGVLVLDDNAALRVDVFDPKTNGLTQLDTEALQLRNRSDITLRGSSGSPVLLGLGKHLGRLALEQGASLQTRGSLAVSADAQGPGSITASDASTLHVQGDLAVERGASLTLSPDSQMIVDGQVEVLGATATVHQGRVNGRGFDPSVLDGRWVVRSVLAEDGSVLPAALHVPGTGAFENRGLVRLEGQQATFARLEGLTSNKGDVELAGGAKLAVGQPLDNLGSILIDHARLDVAGRLLHHVEAAIEVGEDGVLQADELIAAGDIRIDQGHVIGNRVVIEGSAEVSAGGGSFRAGNMEVFGAVGRAGDGFGRLELHGSILLGMREPAPVVPVGENGSQGIPDPIGRLVVDIGGYEPGVSHDVVSVFGDLFLDDGEEHWEYSADARASGHLVLSFQDGFEAMADQEILFLTIEPQYGPDTGEEIDGTGNVYGLFETVQLDLAGLDVSGDVRTTSLDGEYLGTFARYDLYLLSNAGDGDDFSVVFVPEPATIALLAVGGLLALARKRRGGGRRSPLRTGWFTVRSSR
jgi:hypothetical protein